ncbi:ester cyclase [Pseudobacter ginsenosidimutans]|uniref:SnoaL-like polyketide cyclase n=1 Tax=Pseudobacter ginsenosidimutans TaxID=661488 RepID=A0A4Q7MV10_9BACT|nr:ester cyclase [Pseudobacter ginsenosidimutans]QEC40850.1 ester cyclase [Pseudobacter ginsenosidimutans]RZS72418.1 SnoaL-like polyketide cyclase [Pseudobacter ginsenosidimutans]
MNSSSNINKAERNKANYLAAKKAFNEKDIPACLGFYTTDHIVKSMPAEKGRQVIQHFFEQLHNTWGDLKINVEHVVAEDNWVMGRSIATAIHSQTVMGVAPSNKQITASFWDLHLFNEEGLIAETWNLIDNAAIMKQIGLL